VGTFVTKVRFVRGRTVEISAHNCGDSRINIDIEKKHEAGFVSRFSEMYFTGISSYHEQNIESRNIIQLYVNAVKKHIEACKFLSISEKVTLWEMFKVQNATAIVEYARRMLAEWYFEQDLDVLGIIEAENKIEDEDEETSDDSDSSDDDDEEDESEDESEIEVDTD
jgi:hypothetical protein